MNCVATVIGLDISKNVFVAVGRDDQGREAFRKKFSRHQVLAFFAKAAPRRVPVRIIGHGRLPAKVMRCV